MANSRTSFTHTTPPNIAALVRAMRKAMAAKRRIERWEISPATLEVLRSERRRTDRGFEFTFDDRTILSFPFRVDDKMREPWRLIAD